MERFSLKSDGLMSVQYSIPMKVAGDSQLRMFTWKRTHALGRHGGLKLVDQANQIVAVFGSGGSFSSTDVLDIYVQYGERFQLLVLVSGLALLEKLARGRNRGAGGDGGGGGA